VLAACLSGLSVSPPRLHKAKRPRIKGQGQHLRHAVGGRDPSPGLLVNNGLSLVSLET
jgi:hypothetical protein